MNNQRIIDQRWKNTEKSYRQYLSKIRACYKDIGDELVEAVNTLQIDKDKLNKPVPDSVRRQFKRRIEQWEKEGIVKGYFAYLIASLTRYTYYNVLLILVYGIYLLMNKRVNSLSNVIFRQAARDCYAQGLKDLEKEPQELKWDEIESLAVITDLNMKYKDYLTALNQTGAEEMFRQLLTFIALGVALTPAGLYPYLLKQANRILNVKNGKESGIIVDVSRGIGNKAYIKAGGGKDQLVKFVAELDDRTTQMCRSLDKQIFHTNAWNRFTRYSEYYKGLHTFSWFGLEQGLNLPPINDHFHWCRSTITFKLD